MKIAVLSDIHDNIWNLKKVLTDLKKKKAEAIIFCGDFGSPASAKILASASIPTYAVFGNVDGAQFEITNWVKDNAPHFKLGKEMLETDLGGRKVAVCHYPKIARGLASVGDYDAVFCGHEHRAYYKRIGDCTLLNPGEVMGKSGKCTYALYDTKANKAEVIEVS
jgi:putative phosphoesterase